MIFILPTDTCFWLATPISNLESYKDIYNIKTRDLNKPLAILCSDFEYLKEKTKLTNKQIIYLEKHSNPFTVLINKKNILDKELLGYISNLPNSKIYEKIAFRVAHNFMHKKLIRLNWLLFLTSANKSDNPEVFSSIKVRKEFEKEIIDYDIKVMAHTDFCINSNQKSSDIFKFIWDNLEIKYLRKN